MALKYASHGYILENGRVVMDGEARELAANETSRNSISASPGTNANHSAMGGTTSGVNAGSFRQ